MVIALLPGDARQTILGELLMADGFEVRPYAPGTPADVYLFPVPTGQAPALDSLPAGSRALTALAKGVHPQVQTWDYCVPEAVQQKNAAITAEAAIWEAQSRRERTLCGAKALVLGFGRIGQALGMRLRALGAEVTVWARRDDARAKAEGMGCRTLETLPARPEGYDILFNTVPVPVLDAAPDCLTLELASAPGGFRDKSGVVSAGGLPGKYAPRSAAETLHTSILHILQREGLA